MATEGLDVYGGPQARRSSLLTGAGVVVIAVATVVAVAALGADGAPSPPRSVTAGYLEYSNARGGYAFAHPKAWDVSSDGRASLLAAPKRAVMMSFGRTPEGTLRTSARKLLASVASAYSDPAVRDVVQLDEIAGAQAITVAGEGVNDAGVAINFTVTVIEGPKGNLGVTVFVPSSSDPASVLPDVQEVLTTIRFL